MYRVALAAFIVAALVTIALARDDGRYAQSPLKPWFNSLQSPETGMLCCSEADCKRTEATIVGDRYRAALPNGQWVDVPPQIVITNRGNPTGEPILCAMPYQDGTYQLRCFVPGAGL